MNYVTKTRGTRVKDLEGQKFDRLRVIELAGVIKGHSYWNCECDCGNVARVSGGNLHSGHTKSCGCLLKERARETHTTHGHTKGGHRIREYSIWGKMIQRCHNSKDPGYRYYGARGITVCDRWRSFENFYEDMGKCPEGLTIERIDNNKGYGPENCKWATLEEQFSNTRRNHNITFNGETKHLSLWARQIGLSQPGLSTRLLHGWTEEEALTLPAYGRRIT